MRQLIILAAAFIAGAIGLGGAPDKATAGPVPTVAGWNTASPTIEKIGYLRRYYRRYGYGPDVEVVVPPVVVEEGVLNPPTVMIVPVRPVSCGQYRYWDGDRCVDARYHNPYIGPR
jgi:hypothetical protein